MPLQPQDAQSFEQWCDVNQGELINTQECVFSTHGRKRLVTRQEWRSLR